MKTTWKLGRDGKVEPVINVFNTSFWYTSSWYTLWLVNFNSLCQPHQLLGFTQAGTKKKHSEGVDTLLYSTFRHFNMSFWHEKQFFWKWADWDVCKDAYRFSAPLLSFRRFTLARFFTACLLFCLSALTESLAQVKRTKSILFLKCYWWKLI